ncbi:hypothetical protein KA183_15745 [bacterium]|nr:hypothetical protein [bacterium]QQR56559.1 MAG: hypothetical protein IPG59_16335 [Candidatus Melainabacteria bacterium]
MAADNEVEKRIAIANEAAEKFKKARELTKSKDFETALEYYLFAFDNGHLVDGWGGVRLSYIPGEIAELGKQFPPALVALRLRRDERATIIKTGTCDTRTIHELISLNRYLNEDEYAQQLLSEIETIPDYSSKLLQYLQEKTLEIRQEKLKEEKKYDELKPLLAKAGRSAFMSMGDYEGEMLFAESEEDQKRNKRYRDYTRQTAAEAFELACGLRNLKIANLISERLLKIMPEIETYRILILSALKADSTDEASRLLALCEEQEELTKTLKDSLLGESPELEKALIRLFLSSA